MNDWEYEMWWDSVNGMEEDDNYDDMDDWQGGRPINFSGIYKMSRSYESFFRTSVVRKIREFLLQYFYIVV